MTDPIPTKVTCHCVRGEDIARLGCEECGTSGDAPLMTRKQADKLYNFLCANGVMPCDSASGDTLRRRLQESPIDPAVYTERSVFLYVGLSGYWAKFIRQPTGPAHWHITVDVTDTVATRDRVWTINAGLMGVRQLMLDGVV